MRWWFQKRAPELGAETVALEQRMRYNPLQGVDPDVLVAAITEFDAGGLGRLARIVETFEKRDDTMRTASRKMLASVARCAHSVLIVEGEEDNPRALEHQKALRRFWARVRTTSAFSRNAAGGIRLLKRQMAGAQSLGFSVHEIVWRPQADGSIEATFVHVPLEHFENRTGELRFLRRTSDRDGIPMAGGEWLVTVGDGVGIAAAVAAMGKHLSLQDWLLYSERCGQPGLHARTSAAKGSDAWNALVKAVRNFGREWALVTDPDTQMTPISLAASGTLPYPDLIRRMDQAIAALYRGADLSTISGGSGEVGATLQGEESDILEQDACELLSETLQEQVDRYVIRYTFGDEEPLAYVQVSPVAHPNLEREMQVDKHLAALGVKLSKDEALQRYQRTEAETDDDALSPAGELKGPEVEKLKSPGPFNLSILQPFNSREAGLVALRNAAETPSAGETALARALQADLRPVAERLRDLLQEEGDFAAACKRLREELPDLLRAIGREESEFAKALEGLLGAGDAARSDERRVTSDERGAALANEQARGKTVPGTNEGSFAPEGGGETADRNQEKAKAPGNDGKIQFGRGTAKEKADGQARDLGYAGIDDLMRKSVEVPRQRIDAILAGGDAHCSPHEAVAALRTHASIPSGVEGEPPVKLSERPLRHYVCGEGRHHGGEPEIKRLRSLPQAIHAIRHPDSCHHELDQRPIAKFPGEPLPKGAQTVYQYKAGKTFAYADSGVLTGWQNY